MSYINNFNSEQHVQQIFTAFSDCQQESKHDRTKLASCTDDCCETEVFEATL